MKWCFSCMGRVYDHVDVCPYCGKEIEIPVAEKWYLKPGSGILNERYLVGKALGYDGFGITYMGIDQHLKRKVIIREYFPENYCVRRDEKQNVLISVETDPEAYKNGLAQFMAETRELVEGIQIDGIVRTYDYLPEYNTGFLVREYFPGRSLQEILKEKRKFTLEEIEAIIKPVCEILSNVHKNGLLHLNITPEHIICGDDGTVKLMSPGGSRFESADGIVNLKNGYAAEEQYREDGERGSWTDIYTVGALFYRMLTGRTPQEAPRRKKKDYLLPPSAMGIQLQEAQENALMKCLAVDGKERYQSIEDFVQEMFQKPKEEYLIAQQSRSRNLLYALGIISAIVFISSIAVLVKDGTIPRYYQSMMTKMKMPVIEQGEIPFSVGKTDENVEEETESEIEKVTEEITEEIIEETDEVMVEMSK